LTVTKKSLVTNISKKLGLSQKDSLFFVNSFFKSIIDNHKHGVNISNFGSFIYKKTPKRIGRNPKTLETFKIKARKKLTFRPAEEIKKSLN
jgi:nucleoid DNA-binding protein|tara:strand:- start:2659 stop:2931 length:273 start_codon:yes stop_codon:yes gene_type:complete